MVYIQKPNGKEVVSNASTQTIRRAQAAFAAAADEFGVGGEEDVQALINEERYGRDRCMTAAQFLESEGVEG